MPPEAFSPQRTRFQDITNRPAVEPDRINRAANPAPARPMQFRSWRPLRRNTLYGFLSLTAPSIGQDLDDLSVHQKGSRRWVALPGRPMIDPDGNVMRDERGKIRYAAPIRWMTNGIAARFSEKAIALLLEHHPDAFDEGAP